MCDDKKDAESTPIDKKDPTSILKDITDLITNQEIDHQTAKEAVEATLTDYEIQLRTFLVGVAKSKLNRIIRLMELIDDTESVLQTDRLEQASTHELLRIYGLAQSSLVSDLDLIKQIVDMRKELEPREASTIINLLGSASEESVNKVVESGHPGLPPKSRDKVRRVIAAFVQQVGDDQDE